MHDVIYNNEIYHDYCFQKYNHDVIYNDKIYHDFCFKKYIDSLQVSNTNFNDKKK